MTEYQPTPESVQMMLKQVDITEEEAHKYLIKAKGNTFNAICYALGEDDMIEEDEKDIELDIDKNDSNPSERISQFRNVLNKRDQKFQEITKENDDVMDEVHNIGFIAFGPETNNYSKENYRMTLRTFLEIVAKPYIDTGKLEEYKAKTFTEIKKDPNAFQKNKIDEEEMKIIEEDNERIKKLDEERKELEKQLKELEDKQKEEHIDINITEEEDDGNNGKIEATIEKDTTVVKSSKDATDAIREQLSKYIEEKVAVKPLTGLADKMVRKWRCSQSGIIYKESNIKSEQQSNPLESMLESDKINKLATKIMINSRLIKKDQYYVGNVMVVDKWYYYLLTREENDESEKMD